MRAKDVSLVADHVVVFLLFGFLLLGGLDYFFHVVDVILLVFYHLLVGLDLSFSPVFISFNFNVLSLNFFIIFIKFNQFLIFIFDFLPKLLNSIRHPFVFLFEFTYFFFGFDEVFGIEISITSNGFI